LGDSLSTEGILGNGIGGIWMVSHFFRGILSICKTPFKHTTS
jgi:hypothetical protein